MDRELCLEELMRDRGAHRFQSSVLKAEARNSLSETAGGVEAIRHLVEPLKRGVEAWLQTERSRTGRPSFAATYVADLDPALVAFLTIREAINIAAGGCPILRASRAIASALEDEVRMAAFDKAAPELYRTVERKVRQKSWDPVHAELWYASAAQAAEIELPRWAVAEKVHLGLRLIELLIEHTGIVIDINVNVRRNKTVKQIHLTEHGRRWIADHNEKVAFLRPSLAPTVVPPLPWTSTVGGGYLTHAVRPFSLVKRTFRGHVESLKAADLTTTYRGVNALQDTRWRINKPVLEVMEKAADLGLPLPCLPSPEDEPLPPRLPGMDHNEDALRAWKAAAKEVYERNAEAEGKRMEIGRLLTVAHEYRDDPAIFFPHQLDFRGRAYAIPNTLQPQGSDHAKALLTFAEGKRLTDDGLRWLAIHGSNVFGYDKASFKDREQWAWRHAEAAEACARDPLTNRWWTEADSPWSFLSWCFEWRHAASWGSGHVSRLPIALDGSCNGLQHFSAMLRDPIGGAAVNLVPGAAPQDIYQRVADRTVERLRGVEGDRAWIARGWVDFGINRKITKRPVMVLPYGGTMSSCLDYTRAAVRERLKAGEENPFGDQLVAAEAFLASVIWSAIGDVVVAARQVMAWLQRIARVASRNGVPLEWTTPSGFVAHQQYRDTRHRRIKSRLRGSVVFVSHHSEGDTLDASRQALGISPNFVHSLDASAMMLTIGRCLDDGISSFAMIHDSYGTHAADTERMAKHLRDAFVRMYEEHDVLAEFLAAVAARLPPEAVAELPPPPTPGTLDLSLVRESAYFFA